MTSLTPQLKRELRSRLAFNRELGLGELYRQRSTEAPPQIQNATNEALNESRNASNVAAVSAVAPSLNLLPDPAAALAAIRADIGDCTRCRLHTGRNQLVFGAGNPHAELMFVGEGPGADEDAQGLPFVGRAGQLLNNMIAAMGLGRDDVYIANIVKCRPPSNRVPEKDECETCSPFLMRQIAAIQPRAMVALCATAARNLLGLNESMGSLRTRTYDFVPPGHDIAPIKVFPTFHPAYLLRDPRQKKEAWKDLQSVMRFLGLQPTALQSPGQPPPPAKFSEAGAGNQG